MHVICKRFSTLLYSYTHHWGKKASNVNLEFREKTKSKRSWKLVDWKQNTWIDCSKKITINGIASLVVFKGRDDVLVKTENDLPPECGRFWYLGTIVERVGGFDLKTY